MGGSTDLMGVGESGRKHFADGRGSRQLGHAKPGRPCIHPCAVTFSRKPRPQQWHKHTRRVPNQALRPSQALHCRLIPKPRLHHWHKHVWGIQRKALCLPRAAHVLSFPRQNLGSNSSTST